VVALTNDQLSGLETLLKKLLAVKAASDAATAASDQANSVLQTAQKDADQKEQAETEADALVNQVVLELQKVVNGLVATKLLPPAAPTA
jgi:hypothetical protein